MHVRHANGIGCLRHANAIESLSGCNQLGYLQICVRSWRREIGQHLPVRRPRRRSEFNDVGPLRFRGKLERDIIRRLLQLAQLGRNGVRRPREFHDQRRRACAAFTRREMACGPQRILRLAEEQPAEIRSGIVHPHLDVGDEVGGGREVVAFKGNQNPCPNIWFTWQRLKGMGPGRE